MLFILGVVIYLLMMWIMTIFDVDYDYLLRDLLSLMWIMIVFT